MNSKFLAQVHLAYLMDNVEDVFNIMGDYKRKRKRKKERFDEAMKEYEEQATTYITYLHNFS